MKVCIYCRVSTGAQELDQQVLSCQRFCEYKGFEVGRIYSEVGSGKSFKREQLQAMIKDIRAGYYNGLVTFRFDRLGRNAREVAMFLDELESKGVQLFSVNENLDTSTAIGRFARDMILRLAQLERENISEATKQRLSAIAAAGGKLGRPKGSGDKRPRKKGGYYLRYATKQRGVEF